MAGTATMVARTACRSTADFQVHSSRRGPQTRARQNPASGGAMAVRRLGASSPCRTRSTTPRWSAMRPASVVSVAGPGTSAVIRSRLRRIRAGSGGGSWPSTSRTGRSRRSRRSAPSRASVRLDVSRSSDRTIRSPNRRSAASSISRPCAPRPDRRSRERTDVVSSPRASSMAARTARRCERAWASQSASAADRADSRARRSPTSPASCRHTRPSERAAGRSDWMRQITIVSMQAHRPPATKQARNRSAAAGVSGLSRASASTTIRMLPTVWARSPHTRAMLNRNTVAAATGRMAAR